MKLINVFSDEIPKEISGRTTIKSAVPSGGINEKNIEATSN